MRPLPNIESWKGPNIFLIKGRICLGVVKQGRSSPTIKIAVCQSAVGLRVLPLKLCHTPPQICHPCETYYGSETKEQTQNCQKIANGNWTCRALRRKLTFICEDESKSFWDWRSRGEFIWREGFTSWAILERLDTKDSFSKLAPVHSESVFELCFSIFSLWTEWPITNATTGEPKGLILTLLEKVHYVQNKHHEMQIFFKMLTLPATRCNILCDFRTRPHF